MEGFLEKKGGGVASIFSRRNWKERWFVVENSECSYYETFDVASGTAVGLKNSTNILGCEVRAISHHDRAYVFELTQPDGKPFLMCAKSEKTRNLWIKAFEKECKGEKRGTDYEKYYELLGFSQFDQPDLTTINRTYRRLALKYHPDKGGDLAKFKSLQEAFDILGAKIDDEEMSKLFDHVIFNCVIKKGGKGVGLGMVVVEHPLTGQVLIKNMLPTISLVSIDEQADGTLLANDELIGINGINVSTWTLCRVNQRLNNFCVPVDSEVALKFSRKVLREGAIIPQDLDLEVSSNTRSVDNNNNNKKTTDQFLGDDEAELDISYADTSMKAIQYSDEIRMSKDDKPVSQNVDLIFKHKNDNHEQDLNTNFESSDMTSELLEEISELKIKLKKSEEIRISLVVDMETMEKAYKKHLENCNSFLKQHNCELQLPQMDDGRGVTSPLLSPSQHITSFQSTDIDD